MNEGPDDEEKWDDLQATQGGWLAPSSQVRKDNLPPIQSHPRACIPSMWGVEARRTYFCCLFKLWGRPPPRPRPPLPFPNASDDDDGAVLDDDLP